MTRPRRLSLPAALHRSRWRLPRWLWALLAGVGLLLALYLLSPYVALWRLQGAVAAGSPSALAGLVDIDAVREEIRRSLNKDADSRIGLVSDPFIDWLQQALRRGGDDALDQTVTLDWLQGLLDAHGADGGLLGVVDHAFFDAPTDFHVRIGGPAPVHLHMDPHWLGWQVTAVYY